MGILNLVLKLTKISEHGEGEDYEQIASINIRQQKIPDINSILDADREISGFTEWLAENEDGTEKHEILCAWIETEKHINDIVVRV